MMMCHKQVSASIFECCVRSRESDFLLWFSFICDVLLILIRDEGASCTFLCLTSQKRVGGCYEIDFNAFSLFVVSFLNCDTWIGLFQHMYSKKKILFFARKFWRLVFEPFLGCFEPIYFNKNVQVYGIRIKWTALKIFFLMLALSECESQRVCISNSFVHNEVLKAELIDWNQANIQCSYQG